MHAADKLTGEVLSENRGDVNVRLMNFVQVSSETVEMQQARKNQHQCNTKFERHAEAFGNDDAEENDGATNN